MTNKKFKVAETVYEQDRYDMTVKDIIKFYLEVDKLLKIDDKKYVDIESFKLKREINKFLNYKG